MVLVDTSVLLDYLGGRNTQQCNWLDGLISEKLPFALNNFIYQEVLQGIRLDIEYRRVKTYLDSQIFLTLDERAAYARAANLYRLCRKKGIALRGSADCLIAQTAIDHRTPLLHDDDDFDRMARIIPHLRIYRGP